ncbi:MAG: DNA cytosine methyltransferase, partial [Lancefieldella rimae]
MQISYKPLWHTLLEKGMSKEDLRVKAKLTTNAIANMGKDQNISMSTLLKICETLHCNVDAVIEIKDFVPETNQETIELVENKKPLAKAPRLVSLFSGCGGMDKGFEDAGYHRVWANDFDSGAQAVFKLNLGEIDGRDITQVPVDDIPECD